MLLSRLTGVDPLVDGAVMHSLTSLVPLVDKDSFLDIVKAFNDLSNSLSADSDATSVVRCIRVCKAKLSRGINLFDMSQVLTAQTLLATSAASRPELHPDYLTELLSLFVHKGTHQPSRDFSKTAVRN